MNTIHRNSVAAKRILAPWAYILARAFSSEKWGRLAKQLDPENLRASSFVGLKGHSIQHIRQFQKAALLSTKATPEAAERIKRLFSISESQLLQDIFCAITLDEKRLGFFVEVGVGSGRDISNTYMLEKHFGWKGVLVEPNRSSHASILGCRDAFLERRAGASTSGQKLSFLEMIDAGEHSRVVGTGGHYLPEARTAEYEVETITLTEILDGMGAPSTIDFLSLDTEGSEIDVLSGLDLSRYCFKIMVIEHNYDRLVQAKLDSILLPMGYVNVFPDISEFDAWYVHKDVVSAGFPMLRDYGEL